MFGKKGHGGKLGAFVSKVERNGPADSYGIRKGISVIEKEIIQRGTFQTPNKDKGLSFGPYCI